MSEKLQVQKNASAPSQMAPSPQFQERPFTDERYQPTTSTTTISADSPPNIARPSFNLMNMPIFAPTPAANIDQTGIQRQEEEDANNQDLASPEKFNAASAPGEGEDENNQEVQLKEESDLSSPIEEGKIENQEVQLKEESDRDSSEEKPQEDIALKSIQTKLTVGKPGDKYEQEADSMAAKVMSTPDSAIQRQTDSQTDEQKEEVQTSPLANSISRLVQRQTAENSEELQMKPGLQRSQNGSSQASPNIESRLSNSKGGGSPLPDEVRSFMEPRFGADFSSVRVHTDSTAVQMNKDLGAQAFAHSSDIYYGAGKSPGKDELTAHELTHTVQQGGALQRKIDGSSAVSTDRQQSPSQFETDSSNVEAIARQIVESLSADPQDRSGRAIAMLARLAPSIRQAVVAQVQTQLSPQQQQTFSRILGRLGSDRDVSSASQEEIPSGQNGTAPDSESQSETEAETTQGTQVTDKNEQSGKSISTGTGQQSPSSTSETSEVGTERDRNKTTSPFAKTSAPTQATDRNSENSPTSPTNSHQKGQSTHSQTSHPKQGNSSPQAKSTGVSGTASMQSDRKQGSPTSASKEGNSGEPIAANSRPPSPELPTPTARSQTTQALLEQVATAANSARQRFTDRITQGTEAIATSIQQQQAALLAAGERQSSAIQALFANARVQVGEIVTSAQAQLQTNASSHLATLQQGHATTLEQVATTFSSGQERAQTLGNTYAERSLQTADESAEQVQTRIQGMAQEARAIGQEKARVRGSTPEIAEAKARAANEIASDTATSITSGVSDAMRDLRSTGPEAARGFREQGQEAARQVGAGQAEVVNQLTTANQQTTTGIQQAVTQGSQALGNLGTQLTTQLASLEQTIQNQLQTQIAQKSQEIDRAGQQAITTFQQQGQQAIASGDEHLAQFNQQLAGMDIDPELATEVSGEIVGQVNGAYDNLIATTDGAFQQADSALTQAGTEVINAINAISTHASGQIQTFLGQARGQVTQQVGTISGQLGTTVNQVNTAGSSMVGQVATSLEGQIGQIESGFGQGSEQYQIALDEQVTSAEEQAREPRESLPERVDRGQHRAEERARHSLLDDPLGWIGDQLSDLWDMLSDPGFWVGLLVGVALALVVIAAVAAAPFTGGASLALLIAGMALAGGIAAVAGTIVSNITNHSFSNLFSGNLDWSRWSENVGTSFLIGALFGAGLAVAEVLGAGLIALSITAGVFTVVTNYFTGQPLDKNLVANMLLVGVLSKLFRLARGRVPGEEPPVRPPGEEPPVRPPGEEPPVRPPGEEPPGNKASDNRPPRTTELPPEEVSRLVSERKDGTFRLNRKHINNVEKIVGEPEATVAEHAAREAYAAERAANMTNVERVYMGREADTLINPDVAPGTELSADVVGITRQGRYVLIESKGTEILHGLEQLEYSANALGREQVVRYELVVAEQIRTPGFTIRNGTLHLNGQPYLINGKPVHVRTTTQSR
ncbi:MAG TPA: DUF4157 domain-containing protein [Leptolyngbyaceae cyanobacterium]